MAGRRLQDRIRELCARALYAEDPEWSATLYELQSAIQEHSLRVANLSTAATVVGQPVLHERRNS